MKTEQCNALTENSPSLSRFTGLSRKAKGKLGVSIILADLLFFPVIAAIISYFYFWQVYGFTHRWTEYALIGGGLGVAFVLANAVGGIYSRRFFVSPKATLVQPLIHWLAVCFGFLVVAFALKVSEEFSRAVIAAVAVVGVGHVILSRSLISWIAATSPALLFGREKVAIFAIGAAPHVEPSFHKRFQVELAEAVAIADGSVSADVAAISDKVASLNLERVFISVPEGNLGLARALLMDQRFHASVPVALISDQWAMRMSERRVYLDPNIVAFELVPAPVGQFEHALKRAFDVALASTALVLLAPIIAATALAVRLDGPGPIIFRQRRLGQNHVPFDCLKFRSMHVQENGPTVRQATKGDPRVTRVGRIIRATSLDELPQLINVLRGEMSIVGPRPHAIAHDEFYERFVADYAHRRDVKPGLTGWAQVHGYRGETRSVQAMADRVAYDLWYIRNWSIWLDLSIVLRTMVALVRNRNVY